MCEAHVDTDVRVLFAREIFTLDGSGELTNDVTVSRNGVIFRNLDPGTYNIDEDCTGDMTINIAEPPFQLTFDLVIADKGNEFLCHRHNTVGRHVRWQTRALKSYRFRQ